MSQRVDPEQSPLTAAANALEEELRSFEDQIEQARRTKLNGEKGLTRATEALHLAGESQQRTAEKVSLLVQAINRARDRQLEQAQSMAELWKQVENRRGELTLLLRRLETLGNEAQGVNQELQAAQSREGGLADHGSWMAAVVEASARLDKLFTDVADVEMAASQAQLTDVERLAESLRQQLASARNRFKLLREKLEPQA